MFRFWKRNRIDQEVASLGATLRHVGVHPAEWAGKVDNTARVMPTAENVLLRQAEEIEAYREMVDGPTVEHLRHALSLADRNLGHERYARSEDRIAYTEALRAAGREKAEITLCHDKAHRELNGVLAALEQRGLVSGVEDGDEVDIVLVVELALDKTIVPHQREALLGYATTRELLAELTARAEVNGHADYSTVGDERIHDACKGEGVEAICKRGREAEPMRD